MERRLSAILSVDVVGYSRLMEEDEAVTFERLRAHRKELFDPEIENHHGRIFKVMGDGMLAEFASVVDAVECAVALQRAMAERNNGLADGQRIDVRMGINLGDVIIEGEDRHGEGVIIAARLQHLAEPGGITVSRNVAEDVKHKLALGFESLGEHQVKNIAEPISVYRVLTDARTVKTVPYRRLRLTLGSWRAVALALVVAVLAGVGWYVYDRLPPEPPPIGPLTPEAAIGLPVILVLPFQNLTDDTAQDKLGVGVTEDLRDLLWNFPEFQVVSGTSSVGTGNNPANLTDIAHKFGAQFVIEGTVRREGDKAVITAQLIDGTNDVHLWSTRFDEAITDPVALENAAAEKLSASLGGMTGKMREGYERIAWSKPEGELTQFDYYVRGHTHHMRFTPDEMSQARDIYVAGLARYPDSALLRIKQALAEFYFAGWLNAGAENAADVIRVKALVSEARALMAAHRPSRMEEYYLHWISAYIYQLDRDFPRCIVEAKATVALTPYDPWVRGTLAYNMAECGGSTDDAIAWAKESILRQPEGPPHEPEFYLEALAWSYYVADRCQDAIVVIQSMKNVPLMKLAACQVRLGQTDAARSTMAAYVKDHPGWTVTNEAAYPQTEALRERWLADIRAAGLPEK